MSTQHRDRTLSGAASVVICLAMVGAIIWAQVWHGPTLLTLSDEHGLDTGDLLAVPFLLAAIAAARNRAVRTRSSKWSVTAAAMTLGVLLLFSGRVWLASEGGPLVPGAGATLDGQIQQTFARDSIAVGHWSALAFTYDGAAERLYVNGHLESERASSGTVQSPRTPLWIGGNEPYGEHFKGLIDEVRVFDRALPPAEIRRDMTAPVAPAPGLVAAYGFDEGRGATVADVSGGGHRGTIHGAKWVRGHVGSALRFDGLSSLVRVPPSRTLGHGRALTLSAWIKPTAAQSGWRAIAQHQVDAFFLSAGTDRVHYDGTVETVRTIAVVLAGGWFAFLIAIGSAPRTEARRRTWWLCLILFAVGSLADAASFPAGTMCGPLLVALWLAITATGRIERAGLWAAAGILVAITIDSLGDLGVIGHELVRFHGSAARSIALGALFVMAGIAAQSTRRLSSAGQATRPGCVL